MKRIFILTFLCLLIIFIASVSHAIKISVGLIPIGTELPATCEKGETWIDESDAILYFCYAKNTWSASGSGTVLDEDDFASDSAVYPPSQQSTKYYVDTQDATKEDTAVDEAYSSGWDSDAGCPQKDDVYDYLHLIDTDDDGSLDDQEITPTRRSSKFKKWTAEPTGADLIVGDLFYADGVTWNPGGLGGSPVPAHYVQLISTGPNVWKLWVDEDANWYFSYIETPTLLSDEWDDQSGTTIDLTVGELKNKFISNDALTDTYTFQMPAKAEGWNVCFVKEENYTMIVEPNGTDDYYFRTDNGAFTANGAGVSILNDSTGRSTMCCFSTESDVFCTGDVNWEQGS